jgi:transcriptional regulator with XRE-family HTH domain
VSTFSERLRRLRQAANLSQVQLAGDDLSPSYISLLESGKRQPSDDVAALLAERLGCGVEDLLTPAGEERRKQAELNLELGRLSLRDGDPADARDRLQALLAEEGLDRALRDEATFDLADAFEKLLDLQSAVELVLPLYDRAREGGTHLPLATVALYLAHLHQATGDLHAAIRVGEEAVRALTAQRATTTREYFRLAATLAWAYHSVGDANLARAFPADSIEIAQRYADPQGEAALAWNAALTAESLGRLDEALLMSRRALAILTEHAGGTLDVTRLRWSAAYLVLRHDPTKTAEARGLMESCIADLGRLGPAEAAAWTAEYAFLHLLEGDAVEAERLARESLVALAAYPGPPQAQAQLVLGDALAAQGRVDEALQRWTVIVGTLAELPESRESSLLWREVADRFARNGQLDSAVDGYRAALDAVRVRSFGAEAALAAERARQTAAEAATEQTTAL